MMKNPQGQRAPEAAEGDGGPWHEIVSSLHTACDAQKRISQNLLQENQELRRQLATAPKRAASTVADSSEGIAPQSNDDELQALQSTVQALEAQLRRLETERDEWVTKFRGMKVRWERATAEIRDLKKVVGRSG